MTPLKFYDHHRQNYAEHVPLRDGLVGEFHIGDYARDGGVNPPGEFAIALYDFSQSYETPHLSPQLRVFTDATGALQAFLDTGAWDEITAAAESKRIRTRDDIADILHAAGLNDVSDQQRVA